MQRTKREVTDIELIDAINAIIDLIIECYNKPVRAEFEKETRSTQIGRDIVEEVTRRDLMDRYSKIGYESQRKLLAADIIQTGGIKGQEELEL